MTAHGSMIAGEQQTQAISSGHILGKSVLKMNLEEFQHFVAAQFAENPALVVEADVRCPICGGVLSSNYCPSCGSTRVSSGDEEPYGDDDWQERVINSVVAADDDYFEPFACVASPKSFEDFLREQIRLTVPEDERRIAYAIAEELDEDGYLREPLIDISTRLKISMPQLLPILEAVQNLDPPGVAARDLKECLILQVRRMEGGSPDKSAALTILSDYWDLLSRMKLDKIASSLKIKAEEVRRLIKFISEHTTPHPSDAFRDPWATLSPVKASRMSPDVAVKVVDGVLVAEIVDPVSGKVSVDDMYVTLFHEISQKKSSFSSKDSLHIKECVEKAHSLIDALEFRKSTLRKIMDELLVSQEQFFLEGPLHLFPMTKKDLAQRIDMHESTVSRATQDKSIRLPNGEVISFDLLFDTALPIKEMVRALAVERLSDSEIAKQLSESGVQIARRTVAKYRDQMGVLPVEYRM